MDEDVEIIARLGRILAEQPRVIGFLDGRLHDLGFHDIFAANVNIGGPRTHRETGDQRALDQLVRIVAQDFAVLARTRLGFIGIDHQKARPRIALAVLRRFLGHERPFQTGRETRPAATAQAAGLHFLDDLVIAALDDVGGLVPVTALLRCLQVPRLEAVDIGEDPVLVLQKIKTHFLLLRPRIPPIIPTATTASAIQPAYPSRAITAPRSSARTRRQQPPQ